MFDRLFRSRGCLFALAILILIVALMFALGERVRTSARAQLEQELRAQFNSQMLCRGEVDGDICLDSANLGRCLSGEYIDYRTVWKRVHGKDEVRDLLQAKLDELGSPRKLANWLSCQGLSVEYDWPFPGGRSDSIYIVFPVNWIDGISIFTMTNYPFLLKPFTEPSRALVSVPIQGSKIVSIVVTTSSVFN